MKTISRYTPLLVLLVLTLVFFQRLAFSGMILARGDAFAYFYPYWAVRNAALLQGHLPLWSPDVFMGVPLLANPQLGTFYPPNWFFITLSPPDGIRLSILLHVFWALLGTYTLARHLRLEALPALLAAALFGFGGCLGAHIEQINQLQGLAWMPWLFLLYDRALLEQTRLRLGRAIALLAIALALQFFTGHAQTLFITALGLTLVGLVHALQSPRGLRHLLRAALILLIAGLLALLLTLPQLIPMLELTRLSNRSSGLNPNQATAFSLNPLLIGRGLLPSYDGLLFGEYIGYLGVIGLGLALLGAVLSRQRARWPWIALALAGILLALGEFNPVYPLLANLPGFSFFRVPSRWLALFALGTALLAAYGLQALFSLLPRRWHYGLIILVPLLLALASPLAASFPQDVIGPAVPTLTTWIGWALALAALLIALSLRRMRWLPLLVLVELFAASLWLPYNILALPEVYSAQRFTISQMLAYQQDQTPPGRLLSISQLVFDPGDRAALEARDRAHGLSDLAIRISLVDTKLKEILAPNLPLVWGIPSIDGFDGGLLPTHYYSTFSTLLLPPGSNPTTDGRLREGLALESCRGACLPPQRWLNLTNTRYLITDKVYDLWQDDLNYDTQITVSLNADELTSLENPTQFMATALDLLYTGDSPPRVSLSQPDGTVERLESQPPAPLDPFQRVRFTFSPPQIPGQLIVSAPAALDLHAATLVDLRTGDFAVLTLAPWQRSLSSDIKLYQNQAVLPRAFVVHQAQAVPDRDEGDWQALEIMRQPDFDPAHFAVLHGGPDIDTPDSPAEVTITAYSSERVAIQIDSPSAGLLLLSDAFYPGWQATVNAAPAPIYRADLMFRAVAIPAGASEVVFSYQPAWLPALPIIALALWLILLAALLLDYRLKSSPSS